MTNDPSTLSRRDMLAGSIATLAAAMLQLPAYARAADFYRQDKRRPFADRLCDLVIPDTDTPGASKARVADFVLLGLDHHLAGSEPAVYERVRRELDANAGGSFLRKARAQQFKWLAALDQRAYAPPPSGAPAPSPFAPPAPTAESSWRTFKALIVAGYYTSEIGASKELVWDPVPGSRENFTLTDDFRMPSNLNIANAL